MVNCVMCGKPNATKKIENDPEEKISYSFNVCSSFCVAECSRIISIWRWKQLHPDYQHTILDIKKEDTFYSIKEKYLEKKDEISEWRNIKNY